MSLSGKIADHVKRWVAAWSLFMLVFGCALTGPVLAQGRG